MEQNLRSRRSEVEAVRSRIRSSEPVEIAENQVPVFWACGVTPRAVAMSARPPLMITHSPGHMFVTDRLDTEYAA